MPYINKFFVRCAALFTAVLLLTHCDPNRALPGTAEPYGDTAPTVVGSLRATMQDGQLTGTIDLDTIQDRKGLYGLGPAENLQGELLLFDGEGYRAEVIDETRMQLTKSLDVRAPYFVYTHQQSWSGYAVPQNVRTLPELIDFVGRLRLGDVPATAFRLAGKVTQATISLPNLAPSSSPIYAVEAHRGQQQYTLTDVDVDLLGFFSTHDRGVFTAEDTDGHVHLLSRDRQWMGHLESVTLGENMQLFLPE